MYISTFSRVSNPSEQSPEGSRSPILQIPPLVISLYVGSIAVRTGDFRLAYRVLAELKRRGVRCIQLLPSDPLPPDVSAWLAAPAEIGMSSDAAGIPATIDTFHLAVERAIYRVNHQGPIRFLMFGIDPGPRPGLAWVGDGMFLGKEQFEEVDGVVDRVIDIAGTVDHDNLVIRVGNGSKTIANRIINTCMARSLNVERVDEARTSVGVPRHAHSSAALRIAHLPGYVVKEKQRVRPTNGEIRDIQRRSRKVSGGRATIPSDLARAVAMGRLTIGDAIRNHIGDRTDPPTFFR